MIHLFHTTSHMSVLYFKRFDYLKERKRERLHVLVHSSKACNSWGWDRQQSGTWDSMSFLGLAGKHPLFESSPAASQGKHWQEASMALESGFQPTAQTSHTGIRISVFTTRPHTHPWNRNYSKKSCFSAPTFTLLLYSLQVIAKTH